MTQAVSTIGGYFSAGAEDFHVEAMAETDFSVMFRARNADGSLIEQGSISSILWSAMSRRTRSLSPSGSSLTVSAVVFNTLQRDERWTVDGEGYNFRHDIGDDVFLLPGLYESIYKFTEGGGAVFRVRGIIHVSDQFAAA